MKNIKNQKDEKEIRLKQLSFFKEVGISVNESDLSRYLRYLEGLLMGEDIRVRTVLECLFSLNGVLYSGYEDALIELKKLFKDEEAGSVTFGTIIKYRNIGISNIKKKVIEREGNIEVPLSNKPHDYVGELSRRIELVRKILKSNGIDDQDMLLRIANLVTCEGLTIYIARYPLDSDDTIDWSLVSKTTGVKSQYAVKSVEAVSKIFYEIAGIEKRTAQKDEPKKVTHTIEKVEVPYLVRIYGTDDIEKIKMAFENLSIGEKDKTERIKKIVMSIYPIDGSTPKSKEEIMEEYRIESMNQLIGILAAGLSNIKKLLKTFTKSEKPKIWISFGAKTEEEFNDSLSKLSYRERRIFYAMHSDSHVNMSNEEKAKTLGMEEMEFLAQYRIVREKLKIIVNLKLDFSKQELETLKRVVNQLKNPLERQVLILALGLNGTYNSMESIAKEMSSSTKVMVTVESVKELIASAISHINNPIKDRLNGIIR